MPAARLLIGLTALLVSMITTKVAARDLSLATSPSYVPYTPIVEQLFREAGFTAVTKNYPLERAVYLAERGEVDGVFFRTRTAFANQSNLKFLGPLGCADVSAFFLKGHNIEIASADDLRRYRVAVRLGDKLAETFLTKTTTMSTLVLEDVDLLKILRAGRVDVVLLPRARGIHDAQKLDLLDDIAQPIVVSTSGLYIILVNATNDLETRLNHAVVAMKQSGEFARQVGDINQSMGLARGFGVECPAE